MAGSDVKIIGRMGQTAQRKYSPRRTRAERREELLDATLRLIDAEGFSGVSIEAVAREADLAKTVIYGAFGDLPTMLTALMEREQALMISAIAEVLPKPPFKEDPAQILIDGLAAVLGTVREHPKAWRLILLPAEGVPREVRVTADRNRTQLAKSVQPIVAWGLGLIDAESLDAELATQALIAMGEQSARMTLKDPKQYSAERFTKFVGDFVAILTRGPGST